MRVRALLSIAMTDVPRLKRGKWDTHSDPWVFVPLGSSMLSILSLFLQVMVDTTFSPLVYYCYLFSKCNSHMSMDPKSVTWKARLSCIAAPHSLLGWRLLLAEFRPRWPREGRVVGQWLHQRSSLQFGQLGLLPAGPAVVAV